MVKRAKRTKTKGKAKQDKAKAKAKGKAKQDKQVEPKKRRIQYQPRPTLFWRDKPPHKGNCNCRYCHHVTNCMGHGPATDEDPDAPKTCRQLGKSVRMGAGSLAPNLRSHKQWWPIYRQQNLEYEREKQIAEHDDAMGMLPEA